MPTEYGYELGGSIPGLTTSSGFGPVSFSPTIAAVDVAPSSWTDGIATSFSDAGSQIWASFTGGISRAIDGVADYVSGALAGSGMIVGYDRSGNPIRQFVDPNTGAVYTASDSGSWNGAPGGPASFPERTPQNYQTGGPFNWLTNMLSLPAPQPLGNIGTTPSSQPPLTTMPVAGGWTLGQVGVAGGVLLASFLIFRAVMK